MVIPEGASSKKERQQIASLLAQVGTVQVIPTVRGSM